MFTIGELARSGRVSVRMLRHYDAIGLLRPAAVDPTSGYRSYDLDHLATLNRIVALKDLGFSLDEVATIVHERLDVDRLREMLRTRRGQLEQAIEDDRARLARVEARLRVIEREDAMSDDEVTIKQVPAVRVAERSGSVGGFEPQFISPVLGPLFEEAMTELDRAGVPCVGAPIAWYEDAADGDGLVAHAAVPIPADTDQQVLEAAGLTVLELPAMEAAAIVHRGSMDGVMPTIQTLAAWIAAHGHRSAGYNREVYLNYGEGMPEPWETELQEPITS